jgi:endoglucanase
MKFLWVPLLVVFALNTVAEEPAFRRGVNIAGAEFGGSGGTINKEYTYNNEATFKYFGEKGFNVLRVPIKWERIQPKLNGPLDPENLKHLKQNVEWAKKYGSTVLIDLHNYCRYGVMMGDKRKGCLIDAEVEGEVRVKAADFADVWVKLSKEFRDEPAVYGYGLMNEPNGMGKSDWKAISNTAIKGIRDSGDTKLILVAGDSWSSAERWEKVNGPKSWVVDSANNFIYEAHCYFDHDASGSYKKTYDEELKASPKLPERGSKRVKPFIEWCKANNVKGFLGEYGVPDTDPRWLDVLEGFMKELDEAGMGGTYWAAGTYWGKYPLSLQPAEKYTQDRPQMAVLLKYLKAPAAVPQEAVPAIVLSAQAGVTVR